MTLVTSLGTLYNPVELHHLPLERLSRRELIAALVWIDPQGVWTDEDSRAEGAKPLTHSDALGHLHEILWRD